GAVAEIADAIADLDPIRHRWSGHVAADPQAVDWAHIAQAIGFIRGGEVRRHHRPLELRQVDLMPAPDQPVELLLGFQLERLDHERSLPNKRTVVNGQLTPRLQPSASSGPAGHTLTPLHSPFPRRLPVPTG